MFETASSNLNGWVFLYFMIYMLVVLASLGILSSVVDPNKRGYVARNAFYTLNLVLLFGSIVLWFYFSPFKVYGEIKGLNVQGERAAPTVSVSFDDYKWMTGKQGFVVFSFDGAQLNSESFIRQLWGEHPKMLWSNGRAELMEDGGALELVHVVSRKQMIDLNALLNKRFGAGQYELKSVDDDQLIIEQRDGKIATIPMRELLPKSALEPISFKSLLRSCQASLDEKSEAAQGAVLMSAPKAQSAAEPERCTFKSKTSPQPGEPFSLSLNSRYSLSAVSADGAKKLWTTDLRPVNGDVNIKAVDIYAPWIADDKLCFWLVRDKRSLSQVCAKAKTGELLFSKVVF